MISVCLRSSRLCSRPTVLHKLERDCDREGLEHYLLQLLKEDQGFLPRLRNIDLTRLDSRALPVIALCCHRLGGGSCVLTLGSLWARVLHRAERMRTSSRADVEPTG